MHDRKKREEQSKSSAKIKDRKIKKVYETIYVTYIQINSEQNFTQKLSSVDGVRHLPASSPCATAAVVVASLVAVPDMAAAYPFQCILNFVRGGA
jgi:hypothetical protein